MFAKGALYGGIALCSVFLGTLCFLLFPPSDLLRRASLPILRKALNHERIHLGHLELRPLSHITLSDFWLGPPKGYRRPLFSVHRITIRYDLSQILSGDLRILKVQVERPFVVLEVQKKKPNWLAFIEGLPKSEPQPEEPSKESPNVRVWVDRLAVVGLGAAIDDGDRQALFDSMHLALDGMVSPKHNFLHLAVQIEEKETKKWSLAFKQRAPQKIFTEIATPFSLDIFLDHKPAPRPLDKPAIHADFALKFALKSQQLKTERQLEPINLQTQILASLDSQRDRALLKTFSLRLNQEEILNLSAQLSGLFDERLLTLNLKKFRLPLQTLASYLRPFVPGVDFGGTLMAQHIHLKTPLNSAAPKTLPELSGLLQLNDLWATVNMKKPKPLQAAIKDLQVKLAFSTRPQNRPLAKAPNAIQAALPFLGNSPSLENLLAKGKGFPSVAMQGQIQLGKAQAMQATLKQVDLRFAGGATLNGLSPEKAAGRVRLNMPHIQYRHPQLGLMKHALRLSLAGGGDLVNSEHTLDHLDLELPFLKCHANGAVKDLGQKYLRADLTVEPLDLGNILRQVPPKLRQAFGSLSMSGRVGLKSHIEGKLPKELFAPPSKNHQAINPLSIPLQLDTRITLGDIAVKDMRQTLSLSGLDGAVALTGTPKDLLLQANLKLPRATKDDQGLAVKDAAVSSKIQLTSRQLAISALVKDDILIHGSSGLKVRGISVLTKTKNELPLAQFIATKRLSLLGKTAVSIRTEAQKADLLSPAADLHLGPVSTELSFSLAPGNLRRAQLKLGTRISSLVEKRQRARLKGLKLDANLATALPLMKIIRKQDALLEKIRGNVALGLEEIRLAAPKNTLHAGPFSSTFNLLYDAKKKEPIELALDTKLAALEHKEQRLNLKHFGAQLNTKITGPILSLPSPQTNVKQLNTKLSMQVGHIRLADIRPLKNNTLVLDAALSSLKNVNLRQLKIHVPSNGLQINLSAAAQNLVPFDLKRLPIFHVKLNLGLDNPRTSQRKRATFLLPTLKTAGKADLRFDLRNLGSNHIQLNTRFKSKAFSLWTRNLSIEKREPEGFLRTISMLAVQNLNADIPIRQTVTLNLPAFSLEKPRRSIFEEQSPTALYRALRPFTGSDSKLSLNKVALEELFAVLSPKGHLISTAKRKNQINHLSLDLAIDQSTLLLKRLYLNLFGGDIAGAIYAQVLGLKPMDFRLLLQTHITNLDLAYLNPNAEERSKDATISAKFDIKYEFCKRDLEGSIEITHISLDMLDSFLAFLDPGKVDKNVQETRKKLKAWYIKWTNPKVKLVSIWINHSNLNIDIELEPLFETSSWSFKGLAPLIDMYLSKTLKDNRIRRLNILDKLPKCKAPIKEEEL